MVRDKGGRSKGEKEEVVRGKAGSGKGEKEEVVRNMRKGVASIHASSG